MDDVKCPHCKKTFALTSAVLDHIQQAARDQEQTKFEEELEKIRAKTEQDLEKKIQEEFNLKLSQLKKDSDKKSLENQELVNDLEKLMDEKSDLKSKLEKKEFEMKKKLLNEEERIRKEAIKNAEESAGLEILQLKKQLEDTNKSLEEARRKANQKSQQLQGEVAELDIEQKLSSAFPDDLIQEVKKGVSGADIVLVVKSKRGTECGTIIIESKQTKAFSPSWITKLKTDQRENKYNASILITSVLPNDMDTQFGAYEGIYIAKFENYIPLIYLLRQKIIEVAYQKYISEKSTDKKGLVYDYITSHEFHQQIEQMAETYREQVDQITRERAAYERIWKKREEHAKKLLISTSTIYGSLQGIAGNSMPVLSSLEIDPEFDDPTLID